MPSRGRPPIVDPPRARKRLVKAGLCIRQIAACSRKLAEGAQHGGEVGVRNDLATADLRRLGQVNLRRVVVTLSARDNSHRVERADDK
jgi:hypothetical protein